MGSGAWEQGSSYRGYTKWGVEPGNKAHHMEVTRSGEWSLGTRLIVRRLHCAIKESGSEANHRGVTLGNIAGEWKEAKSMGCNKAEKLSLGLGRRLWGYTVR